MTTAATPLASPTARLRELLRAKHGDEGWVFLEGVQNEPGSAGRGYCDALAFGCWPSRGYEVHGFECKASRGDWLRELQAPGKADPFFVYCDYWWLVVSDPTIALPEELPPGWGLLVARGDRLVRKVNGGKLTPRPLTKGFVAALLQRGAQVKANERQRLAREGFSAGVAHQQREIADSRAQRELDALRAEVRQFEEALGAPVISGRGFLSDLHGRDRAHLGRALRAILADERREEEVRMSTQFAIRAMASALEAARRALAEIIPVPPAEVPR